MMPGFTAELTAGSALGVYAGASDHPITGSAGLAPQIDAPWWTGGGTPIPEPNPQVFFSDPEALSWTEDLGGEDPFGIMEYEDWLPELQEAPVAWEAPAAEGAIEGGAAAEAGLGATIAGGIVVALPAAIAGDVVGNTVQQAVTNATGSTEAGQAAGAGAAAATGAAVGAAIGSIVPGVGTALGAGIGAVAGLVAWAIW